MGTLLPPLRYSLSARRRYPQSACDRAEVRADDGIQHQASSIENDCYYSILTYFLTKSRRLVNFDLVITLDWIPWDLGSDTHAHLLHSARIVILARAIHSSIYYSLSFLLLFSFLLAYILFVFNIDLAPGLSLSRDHAPNLLHQLNMLGGSDYKAVAYFVNWYAPRRSHRQVYPPDSWKGPSTGGTTSRKICLLVIWHTSSTLSPMWGPKVVKCMTSSSVHAARGLLKSCIQLFDRYME